MSLYLEFDQLVHALVAAKVKYAVAGGLAVGLHGFVRATEDIDLLVVDVLVPESNATRKILDRAGAHVYRDITICVVSVEDLIEMKKRRGSKQDWADIESLGKTQ